MDYEKCAMRLIERTAAMNRLMARTTIREFWKGETYVLFYLYDVEASTPGELSAAMEISTARVATTLNALEEKGWIARQMDDRDRRKIRVTLTDAGRDFVKRQQQKLTADTEAILRALGERDAEEYLRIMDRVIEYIEAQING